MRHSLLEASVGAPGGESKSFDIAPMVALVGGRYRGTAPCAVCGEPAVTLDDAGRRRHPLCAMPAPVVEPPARGDHSGVVTSWRRRNFRRRPAVWVDWSSGAGVDEDGHPVKVGPMAEAGELVAGLAGLAERIILVGTRPGGGESHDFLAWARRPVAEPWTVSRRGHYLERVEAPVLTYETADSRAVEICRGETWFGPGHYTPAEAAAAMREVGDAIGRRFSGCGVLASPATTGRELFTASIPRGVEYPVLTEAHQGLIRATSGQGRIEGLLDGRAELPGVAVMDGRLMYAALCRQLGAGPAIHDDKPTFDDHAPGRYLVRVTVPWGWSHVGILPAARAEGGWEYPAEPGRVFQTWADGAELLVAKRHGWAFDVLERLLLVDAGARPLDTWARRLIDIHGEVSDLAGRAVRAIILHAIGAFYGRPQHVTRSCPLSEAATSIPAGVDPATVEVGGETVQWVEQRATAWPELSHPEWSARVWGRCRARMLDGPGSTGALHVPRGDVLAIATDALYLTSAPAWPDDGRPGRLRLKAHLDGPVPAPARAGHLGRLVRNGGR